MLGLWIKGIKSQFSDAIASTLGLQLLSLSVSCPF